MSNLYVYQIKGVLEKPNKDIGGIRVLVCNKDILELVDIPPEIFDKEILQFLKFRLAVNDFLDIRKLPYSIQNRMRAPMNRWLDNWVMKERILGNIK
jgi:hypothetical protein